MLYFLHPSHLPTHLLLYGISLTNQHASWCSSAAWLQHAVEELHSQTSSLCSAHSTLAVTSYHCDQLTLSLQHASALCVRTHFCACVSVMDGTHHSRCLCRDEGTSSHRCLWPGRPHWETQGQRWSALLSGVRGKCLCSYTRLSSKAMHISATVSYFIFYKLVFRRKKPRCVIGKPQLLWCTRVWELILHGSKWRIRSVVNCQVYCCGPEWMQCWLYRLFGSVFLMFWLKVVFCYQNLHCSHCCILSAVCRGVHMNTKMCSFWLWT